MDHIDFESSGESAGVACAILIGKVHQKVTKRDKKTELPDFPFTRRDKNGIKSHE